MHLNCRSLKKNFTAVTALLNKCHPITALAATETWLNEINKDMFSINGYTFLHLGRINKSGGGVGLYINATLDSTTRVDLSFTDENLECLFAEIVQSNKCNILIACFYRPPNADVISFNSLTNLIFLTNFTKKSTKQF